MAMVCRVALIVGVASICGGVRNVRRRARTEAVEATTQGAVLAFHDAAAARADELGIRCRDVLKELAKLMPEKYSTKIGGGLRFEGPKASCALCSGSDSLGLMMTNFGGSSKFTAGFSTSPGFSVGVLGEEDAAKEHVILVNPRESLEEALAELFNSSMAEAQELNSSFVLEPTDPSDPELTALTNANATTLSAFNRVIFPQIFRGSSNIAIGESFTHGMVMMQMPAASTSQGWGWYASSHKTALIDDLSDTCPDAVGDVNDRVSDTNITEPLTIYLATRALLNASDADSGLGTTGWAGAGFPDHIPDWFSVAAVAMRNETVIAKVLRVEVGMSMFEPVTTEVRRAITRRLGVAAVALAHARLLGAGGGDAIAGKMQEFQCRVLEIDISGCSPVKLTTWGAPLGSKGSVEDCDCGGRSDCSCPWPPALMDEGAYGNPWR